MSSDWLTYKKLLLIYLFQFELINHDIVPDFEHRCDSSPVCRTGFVSALQRQCVIETVTGSPTRQMANTGRVIELNVDADDMLKQ